MRRIAIIALAAVPLIGAACSREAESPSAGADTTAGPVSNSGNDENPPAADVAVDSCAADNIGWITAAGIITNHSSKPSDYLGSVEFVAGGVRYAEGGFSATAVAPGQQVRFEASGLTDAQPATECRVTQVERFAS